MLRGERKPIVWIGSSKKDLMELPKEVRRMIGYSIGLAQAEEQDKDTKPLKGFGSADVREIVKLDMEGTYRAVYTVKLEGVIYVLHVFKKKSKSGIKTPKQEIDLIRDRLKMAQHLYKERNKNES